MDALVYNIPVHLAEAYRGRRVIVRAHEPAQLASCISQLDPNNVHYAQLLSLDAETEPLTTLPPSLPLDLVMTRPDYEFPHLCRFSQLRDQLQIRVSVPVSTGFSKAVRLALALNFAVKLEVGQPDHDLIEELKEVLDLYLHRSTVAQPVEYFHSTLLSFYHQEASSLWFIQEEDPEQLRFVSDDGREGVTKRLNGLRFNDQDGGLPGQQPMIKKTVECDDCEFFNRCGGYFKWPNSEFDCEGIKTLFGTMRDAAQELRHDVSRVPVAQRGQQQ